MRTTRSTDTRSTRPKAPRLRVAGAAVALAASSAVTAGALGAMATSAADREPVCGATSSSPTSALDAAHIGCDDDLRATYTMPHAWPQKRAAAAEASGEVFVKLPRASGA